MRRIERIRCLASFEANGHGIYPEPHRLVNASTEETSMSDRPPRSAPDPSRAGASLRLDGPGATAVVVGLLVGFSSTGIVRTVGADPGALTWGIALPLLALAMVQHGAHRIPAPTRLVLCVLGSAAIAAPSLVADGIGALGRGAHLSPGQSLLLFLVCWLFACAAVLVARPSLARATPGGLLLGAVGAVVGFVSPAWLVLAIPLLATAATLRPQPAAADSTTSEPERSHPGTTLAFVVLAVLGAWSLTFQWSALRAWLDPTPLGFWLAAVCAVLGFVLGWAVGRLRERRFGLEPLLAAVAILLGMAMLPVLAPWLAPRLPALLLNHDPTLLLPGLLATPGAVLCFFLGLSTPSRSQGPVALWSLSLSAGAGVVLGTQGGIIGSALLPLCAVLGGALVLLVAQHPMRRLAGLTGAVVVCVAWWQVPPVQVTPLCSGWTSALSDDLTIRRHVSGLSRSDWELAAWGPEGTIGLRRVEDALVADIDGFPIWFQGRNPAAVRLAGHLPALLAGEPSRFLVLGDELGWASIALLSHAPDTIETAVAQPELMRAVASVNDDVRRALLAPEIQLRPIPGYWLLRHSGPMDAIVQIQLRPWADSGSVPLDGSSMKLARRRLRPGGVYVALLATDRLPADELRSLVSDFADTFPAGAGCLPPAGADHLLLIGPVDDRLPSLSQLRSRFETSSAALGTLGFTDALDLADRCVLPASSLAAWAAETASSGARWAPYGLPATIHHGLELPLASLSDHVGAPAEVWDIDVASADLASLERRFEAVRQFLALLGDTNSGNMESLFERAKALQASTNGTRELDTLVAPHLARAREHMNQARRGGVQHRGWQQAINELTLARMLHPAAIEARQLEAMVHEARGDNRRAEKLYRSVIEDRSDHLQALFGLARIQILEGREAEAEATLVRVTELHPREVAAHQVLGVALLRFERLDDAEPVLRKAAALAEPDQAQPQAALAELFLAQGRPSVAQAHAEMAVRIEPSAYHYTLLGRCHFDLDRLVPAERAFRQAVILDSEFYPARAGLAHIYALWGDYEQAQDALQAVLAADNGNQAALINLQEIQRLIEVEKSDPRLNISP